MTCILLPRCSNLMSAVRAIFKGRADILTNETSESKLEKLGKSCRLRISAGTLDFVEVSRSNSDKPRQSSHHSYGILATDNLLGCAAILS